MSGKLIKSGLAALGGAMAAKAPKAAKETIEEIAEDAPETMRAFHVTDAEPFEKFDFSLLGRNMTNASDELVDTAQLGAWMNDQDLRKNASMSFFPNLMEVEFPIPEKHYGSLDELAAFIRELGGPENARDYLLRQGHRSISVADEEMGGTSYVGLDPEVLKILRKYGLLPPLVAPAAAPYFEEGE